MYVLMQQIISLKLIASQVISMIKDHYHLPQHFVHSNATKYYVRVETLVQSDGSFIMTEGWDVRH